MLQKVNKFILTKFCEDIWCYYSCSVGENLAHGETTSLAEKSAATLEEIQ